ncbi:MAG: metal-dependent hydrolase [Rubrobacteraceae bacterium]
MTGTTHQAGAVLAAGFYAQTLARSPVLAAAALAAAALAAACLPDADYDPESDDRGRYEHRGLPHSLVLASGAVCLLALVAVAVFGYPAADAGAGRPLTQAAVSLPREGSGQLVGVSSAVPGGLFHRTSAAPAPSGCIDHPDRSSHATAEEISVTQTRGERTLEPGYLRSRMEDVRAYEAPGASPTAREDRTALLGALAGLGLPENAFVRDPSQPRLALYLYRDGLGHHKLDYAPWRLARHAPPGMLSRDVRRVGRELRRGLIGSLSGVAVALFGAFFASLLARALAPGSPAHGLSPVAYLQAAPVIIGCVAVLCGVVAMWHAAALLLPRAAMTADAESRAAFRRAFTAESARNVPADKGGGGE